MLRKNWWKNNEISFVILCLLSVSALHNRYITVSFFLIYSVWGIARNRGRIHVVFPMCIVLVYVAVGCFSGMASNAKIGTWPFFRDILYVMEILVAWTSSTVVAKKYNYDDAILYKNVFLFSCSYTILKLLFGIVRFFSFSNINAMRSAMQMNEYICAIGVILFFFRTPSINKCYFGKKIDSVLGIGCIIGALFSLSRTTVLLIGIGILFFLWQDSGKVLRILMVGILGLLVLLIINPKILIGFLDKFGRIFIELSTKSSWNDTSIVQNWRGYEVYSAKSMFINYSLFQRLFGGGFGTGIDVNGYAYLVTGEDTLAVLHNGYYTSLIKTGIIGLVCVIFFWISLYMNSYSYRISNYNRKIYRGLVVGLIVSMWVIMGLFAGQIPFIYILVIVWNYSKKYMINK